MRQPPAGLDLFGGLLELFGQHRIGQHIAGDGQAAQQGHAILQQGTRGAGKAGRVYLGQQVTHPAGAQQSTIPNQPRGRLGELLTEVVEDAEQGQRDGPPAVAQCRCQRQHDLRQQRQIPAQFLEDGREPGNDEQQQEDQRSAGQHQQNDRIDHRRHH